MSQYKDLFLDKKVVVFGLPGAFTPTCSASHLPGYEELYDEIKNCGVDEVYCISVNDEFVMKAWFEKQGVSKVKYIADGNGDLTDKLNMLVSKRNLGFGSRSWRYSAVLQDGQITQELQYNTLFFVIFICSFSSILYCKRTFRLC